MSGFQNRKFDGFRACCLLATVIIGLISPSFVIFLLEITIGDISPLVSLQKIAHRQFAEGDNLFLLAVFGLIPFVALCVIMLCLSSKLTRSQFCLTVTLGLVGILAVMIPSHADVWRPLYTDEHASSTAVIAFLFIPFMCLVTMTVGLLFAYLIAMRGRIRKWLIWINEH